MALKRGKPLTREESQAHTRELVLEAAEEVFLESGFLGTTVAQIAANAGRTPGSIYANFASKEELCLAVLERHYRQVIADLAAVMAEAGDDLDRKLETFTQWWKVFCAAESYTILSSEYILAVRRNPEQFAQLTAFWAAAKVLLRSIVADANRSITKREPTDADLDAALAGIVSTALGLAMSQAGTMVDTHTSGHVLRTTLRMWISHVDPRA